MRCDGGGKGYKCTSVDGPPTAHTRSPFQPPWADEYHELATSLPEVGDYVFEFTNDRREKEGVSPLKHDPMLTQIACWHNEDMIAHSYLGHNDSDDRMPWDRVAREHRRLIGSVGENAYDMAPREDRGGPEAHKRDWAADIVQGWMDSPGHRESLMAPHWTHLGACVSRDSVQGNATQVFANVQAYLDRPLPWAVTPGDSVSVSFTLVKANRSPVRYAFVPTGESARAAFRGDQKGKPMDGKLYLPTTPGTYTLHVLVPEGGRQFAVLSGPRVLVTEKGRPAYLHGL